MVTRGAADRLQPTLDSIAAYCTQTHPDKELVVLVDERGETADVLRRHVDELAREDIRVLTHKAGMTLGAARNLSLEFARGDVVCQWDDDDLHHPTRLTTQLERLTAGGFEAVYLQDVLQYFPAERAIYWTNWRATEAGGHPGTLMARRDAPLNYPAQGATAALGEDSAVALSLIARGSVGYLAAQPHLFLYISHGRNSWHEGHHRMLATELSISIGLLRRRENLVREGLAAYGNLPADIAVRTPEALAFTLGRA